MAYTVTFTSAGAKSLDRLDKSLLRRLKAKILPLADAPRPAGAVKLAGHENLYRLRVGEYRVIYAVDDAARSVVVTIVAHRREVCRDL